MSVVLLGEVECARCVDPARDFYFDLWGGFQRISDSAVPPYDGTNGAAGHSVVDPTIWCFNIVVREIDLFRKRGRVSTQRR
jgi:hypothetical protein